MSRPYAATFFVGNVPTKLGMGKTKVLLRHCPDVASGSPSLPSGWIASGHLAGLQKPWIQETEPCFMMAP